MSTLSYQPERDCINSLGIPVDNLTLDSAVRRIMAMAAKRDGVARLVSTLNVDFLVNSLGTALIRPRHPELLDVLRSSDLVTADGFPIVWLSRLLGKPLPERVCGSDLVPALAERCARENRSMFLLGGAEGVAAEAADVLRGRYPTLRIAGTAAPQVVTAGPGLENTTAADEELLEYIHASGADILLVGLGNPKQELWFNRNRRQLKVPVSIGVGGSFEFLTGRIRRAPAAWQKANLEWVYRIGQDPARLWKRYSKGLFKLGLLAGPVLATRIAEACSLKRQSEYTANTRLSWQTLWSSKDQSISLLRLPEQPHQTYLAKLNRDLSNNPGQGELRILDFSQVRRIALRSQQELFNLAGLLRQQGDLQVMGMSSSVRRQLAATRLLDLLESTDDNPMGTLARRPEVGQELRCQTYALANTTLVTLAGRVSRDTLAPLGFVECLLHSVRDRHCIIDVRNVDLLESSGIAELLPLLRLSGGYEGRVSLSGVGANVRQMLRMAEVPIHAAQISDGQLLSCLAGDEHHD